MLGRNEATVKTINPTPFRFKIIEKTDRDGKIEENEIKVNPQKIMNLLSGARQDFYVEGSSFYVVKDFFGLLSPSNKCKPVKKLKELTDPVSVQITFSDQTVSQYSVMNFFLVIEVPCYLDNKGVVYVGKHFFT